MDAIHILLESFHPLHFVCSMGIGITSVIMYNFPIHSIRKGIRYIGIIYFFINLVVIFINHTLFSLKYLIFPYLYSNDKRYSTRIIDLLHKSNLAVFMGASTMSFSTVVNMLYYLKPNWGIAILVLWWINVFQSLCCAFFVPFFLFSNATNKINKTKFERNTIDLEKFTKNVNINHTSTSKLDKVTPTILLPLVTCTVAAATGGLVMNLFNNSNLLISMIIVIIMLWSVAVCSSFILLGVFFTRLFAYGLPKNSASFTTFVPIGVMGQGSLGAMLTLNKLGELIETNGFSIIGLVNLDNSNANSNSNNEFNQFNQLFKNILTLIGIIIALILTAFGVILTIWGILSVLYWYIGWPRIHNNLEIDSLNDKTFKFSNNNNNNINDNKKKKRKGRNSYVLWTPTMWAATFPFATMALANNELFIITNIIGFKIVATIYAWAVIIITTWCMICTAIYIVPYKKLYKSLKNSKV